jgi:ATP-dependent helicase/nuclease subunit B
VLTFIFGTYGSGKTTLVLQNIKKSLSEGRHTFLIVPEQEAVSAERMTLKALPPSAQLELEVLNFSRLYNRVCREYGGLSYSYIKKPIKHLLMWQNLRELAPLLEEYSSLAESDASLCELMLNAVNEFKMCSVTPEAIEKASKNLTEDDPLRKKLRDLALIYASFDRLISEKYSDSSDDLSRLYDTLSKHDFFANCDVYIDSFTSFTAVEHKVIERIFASASNVTVTIPLPSPEYDGNYTASIRHSLERLQRNAEKHGGAICQTLIGNRRTSSPALSYLTQNLWQLEVQEDNHIDISDGSIVMEKCENAYAEAEAAAAHILELLRNGARCHEIAVIARDPSRYKGIIEPAFEKNGIPFFMSDKTDLSSLAPIKLILSALKIRRFNWQRTDVLAHVKTGLYPIDQRKIDLFEEYVNTWNIRGAKFTDGDFTMNPDGYKKEMSDRAKDILLAANETRKAIVDPLTKLFVLLDNSENIADMCRALYEYISELGLEERLLELAKKEAARGKQKSASEFSSLYGVILNTLADVGEAMEDQEASVEELYAILKTVFDQTDVGTIPTSIDEVTIGSAATMRTSNIKYTFVLGLCESIFPAAIRDTGVFGASERERLNSLDIELSGDVDSRSSDELMYVLRAFSSPSERLYLFTATSELGASEQRFPSLAFNRVKVLFPSINIHEFKGNDFEYLTCAPKGAVGHLRSIRGTSAGEALRIAAEPYLPSLSRRTQAESFSPKERLSEAITSKKRFENMTLSFSRFEKYVSCPFKYFCYSELKLRESGRAKFEFSDMGTFVHYVLEKLLRYSVTELPDGSLPDRDMIIKKGDAIVDEYIDGIFPSDAQAPKKLSHLFSRLKKLSRLVIDNMLKEMEHSKFRPVFFELETNGVGSNPRPMVFIPEDKSYKVTFTGIIDRVDLFKKDGEVYIRVVDYKTGSKTFSLGDVEHGMNLQMLLYLCTLCRNRDNEFAKSLGLEQGKTATPAGMIYLLAKVPVVSLEDYTSEDTVIRSADSEIERNGLLLENEDILYAMNDELDSQFLAGISQKDGIFNGNALISGENFEKLFSDMEKVILKITAEMRSGCADARPLKYDGKDPCSYCKYRSVCRYIPRS